MTDTPRFTVERDRYLTTCECPPQLCRHADGMRQVYHWQVWDAVREDYAEGGDEFETRREASTFAAECNARWEASPPPVLPRCAKAVGSERCYGRVTDPAGGFCDGHQ